MYQFGHSGSVCRKPQRGAGVCTDISERGRECPPHYVHVLMAMEPSASLAVRRKRRLYWLKLGSLAGMAWEEIHVQMHRCCSVSILSYPKDGQEWSAFKAQALILAQEDARFGPQVGGGAPGMNRIPHSILCSARVRAGTSKCAASW